MGIFCLILLHGFSPRLWEFPYTHMLVSVLLNTQGGPFAGLCSSPFCAALSLSGILSCELQLLLSIFPVSAAVGGSRVSFPFICHVLEIPAQKYTGTIVSNPVSRVISFVSCLLKIILFYCIVLLFGFLVVSHRVILVPVTPFQPEAESLI